MLNRLCFVSVIVLTALVGLLRMEVWAISSGDILINEVAFKETNDEVEFYVVNGGKSLKGLRFFELGSSIKTFPDITPNTGDYIVLHFNGNPANDENDTTGKQANGYWNIDTGDSGLQGTDNTLQIKRPVGDNIRIDVVIYSNNSGGFTGNTGEANGAVADSHWNSTDFNAGDSMAWIDSDNISSGQSIGRDGNFTDSNSKNDWAKQVLTMGRNNASLPQAKFMVNGTTLIQGVTVKALQNGIEKGSAATDVSGHYTIPDLPAGTYTVTASKTGYAFTPISQEVTVPPDATGINFTGTINLRVIRVVSTSASPGSTVSIPIELDAQGDENALGFSLTFDPAILSNPQAARGKDAGFASSLETNSSQVSTGYYGIALALSAGKIFAAGSREIVVVNFSIASGIANTSTTIGFGDQPIGREVVDAGANILSIAYISGTVRIASGYEADAAPRSHGDNDVTIADRVQVGRFAAGLDEVDIGGEFQRADCAPKGTLGNGKVTIADWVQAGRYAARLDTLTPAGGPTCLASPAPSLAALKAFARANPGCTIRAVKATSESSKVNSLVIELDTQGNENAIGFSLTYDTNFLTFEEVTLANAASGALLLKNTSQLDNGRLGIALALPPGQTFSAGIRAIVEISFKASKVDLPVTTQVSFGDQPIRRDVVAVSASPVSASYTDASVTILPGGKPDDVIIYPNPFRPGGHLKMRFENLPENASIRIYNIAGELVKSEEDIADGLFCWDGKNDKEKEVSSGVYIYVIKGAKGKIERGKIAVIR